MTKIKFSDTRIKRIKAPAPGGKQLLYWDDSEVGGVGGLGIQVSPKSATKTYIVRQKIKGTKKPRQVKIGPTSVFTVEQARDRARDILTTTFYVGIDPKAVKRGEATLRSALEEYIKSTDLRPRSAAGYREGVERHLRSWLDLPLRDITRDMVEDRHREIAAEIAASSRHSGQATANGVMRTFRLLYNFVADRAPSMPQSPVKLKRRWNQVTPRTRHLGNDQLPIFYRRILALKNPVARDYLLLVLFTGMRRREATGLRWQHVDLDAKVIPLPAASTKAKRPLDLPMSDFVFKLLSARRAIGDAEWVFPAASRSGHIEEPRYPLDKILDATGINVSMHDLRRTFITVAESTEMSPLALKALVNHALGKDVTEGYVQMNAERLRAPAQRVCDRLRELCRVDEPT